MLLEHRSKPVIAIPDWIAIPFSKHGAVVRRYSDKKWSTFLGMMPFCRSWAFLTRVKDDEPLFEKSVWLNWFNTRQSPLYFQGFHPWWRDELFVFWLKKQRSKIEGNSKRESGKVWGRNRFIFSFALSISLSLYIYLSLFCSLSFPPYLPPYLYPSLSLLLCLSLSLYSSLSLPIFLSLHVPLFSMWSLRGFI